MTADQYDALRTQLIAHEGFRLRAYLDTAGKVTVGIGRNLTDKGLTEHEANYLYENDIEGILRGLTADLPWYPRLDPVRQRVLIDIAFNAGLEGLLKFHKMLEAARIGEFPTAAREILNSQLAEARKHRLSALMRAGETP